MTIHAIAISGGKDSVAMALGLNEREPRDYTYIITPTGDELPEMVAHWAGLEARLGRPFTRLGKQTLSGLVEQFGALPNHRQRWCTRMLKIEPTLAWVRSQSEPVVMYVGLRADEEERKGIYSNDVTTDFPLRRWGWGLPEVRGYLKEHGINIPARTDCARCYGQRLDEWHSLWAEHPDAYADAARQERETGHTFRSAQRDAWPAGLDGLAAEFARGRLPKKTRTRQQLSILDGDDQAGACRVCSL